MSVDQPVVPRPAATVIVLRPAESGFEVFLVRRHPRSSFAAGAYVFPGGTERPDDRLETTEARALGLDPVKLHSTLSTHKDPFAEHPDRGVSLWLAALRELFEEAGVLLAEPIEPRRNAEAEPGGAERLAALRNRLQEGSLSLSALAREQGLRLAAHRLSYFSRWITPVSSPKRFDTRFFVAEVSADQWAGHCRIETVDDVWIRPREALTLHQAGGLPLMSVTREHIKRLAEFDTLPALMEFARTKTVRVVEAQLDAQRRPFHSTEQLRQW